MCRNMHVTDTTVTEDTAGHNLRPEFRNWVPKIGNCRIWGILFFEGGNNKFRLFIMSSYMSQELFGGGKIQ